MKKKKLDFEERVEKLEDILEERLEGIENRLKEDFKIIKKKLKKLKPGIERGNP